MKKKRKGILFNTLIILFSAVAIFSGYKIFTIMSTYTQGASAYETLREHITLSAGEDANAAAAETLTPAWPVVDFDALGAINSDIVAWLYQVDTAINYPVVHGSDNEFYLEHLFNGDANNAGTLFVDAGNTPGFVDQNTIIYGHNMKDGSMFGSIAAYKDQSYFDAHPTFLLLTPKQNYVIELFAGYVTDTEDVSWQSTFSDPESYEEWLRQAQARSTFTSDVQVDSSDRVITLSTCSYEFNDARYVVLGKLTPA